MFGHALILSLSLSLSLTHTHIYSFSHTHTLSLSLSLSHTHTHTVSLTLTLSLSHTHTDSVSHNPSLTHPIPSLTHSQKLALSLSHTHIYSLSLSLSYTHTHSHTLRFHTHASTAWLVCWKFKLICNPYDFDRSDYDMYLSGLTGRNGQKESKLTQRVGGGSSVRAADTSYNVSNVNLWRLIADPEGRGGGGRG